MLMWFSERRKREVLPAHQAQILLIPLRRFFMPVAQTLDRFGVTAGRTVLELGPGPGYYSVEASARLGSGGRLLCLDLQRGMLERLRERLPPTATNVDLVVADATALPLRDACADSAFLVTVLGEIPDQAAALGELRRVLRPGGSLGFAETLVDADIVWARDLRRLCGSAGLIEEGFWRNPHGLHNDVSPLR